MACHEIGALRLGLMNVLGIEDEAMKKHDEAEVGELLTHPGPICSLAQSKNLKDIKIFFQNSLVDLENKLANLPLDHKDLAYYRSLMILTKNVELNLELQIKGFEDMFRHLDEMHDFVHEIHH